MCSSSTLTTLPNSDRSLLDASVIRTAWTRSSNTPVDAPPDARLLRTARQLWLKSLGHHHRPTGTMGRERTHHLPFRGTDMADDDFEPTPLMTSSTSWSRCRSGSPCPEGTPSGDRRQFGAGALRSRPLPLPLSYQRVNMDGHDGSVQWGPSSAHGGRLARVRRWTPAHLRPLKSTKSSASWLNRAAGWACPSTPTTSKSR